MTAARYLRPVAIGAVCGLRSFTGPAATLATGDSVWTGIVSALAAGECVGDKLPIAPSRLWPPALGWRIVAGGMCGGVLARRAGAERFAGTIAGAAGAIAAAYAGYHLRKRLTTDFGLPDFAVAVVEDGIALAGARAATAR